MSSLRRVLVVDDDPDIVDTLSEVLALYGYEVLTANDGADALAALRKGYRPAVILLDVMMPTMDGEEFVAAQKNEPALAGIPVVFFSGGGHLDEKAARLKVEVLPKPISLPRLIAVLDRYCQAKS